jgi:CRP-like cAMP-binding protein
VATVASCTDAVVWRIPGETFLSALQEVAAEPSALVEVMADRLGRLPPD